MQGFVDADSQLNTVGVCLYEILKVVLFYIISYMSV